MPDPAELQRNYKQFMDLLPLTLALAGLPPSVDRYYGEEQIEARLFVIRHAFKTAKTLAPDPVEAAQKYKEFVDLLPLTLELAGLPLSTGQGKYYGPDAIEARSFSIKHGYKAARSVTRECIQPPA